MDTDTDSAIPNEYLSEQAEKQAVLRQKDVLKRFMKHHAIAIAAWFAVYVILALLSSHPLQLIPLVGIIIYARSFYIAWRHFRKLDHI